MAMKIVRHDGFFLRGRPAMLAANAGEHGRDMAIGAIERRSALREMPGEGRQPTFDRAHRGGIEREAAR